MMTIPVVLDSNFQINLNGSNACNLPARPISISKHQEKMFETIAKNVVEGYRGQVINQISMKAKCGYYVDVNRRCRYGGVIEIADELVEQQVLKDLDLIIVGALDALGEIEPLFTEIAMKDGDVAGKTIVEHGKQRPSKKSYYVQDMTVYYLIKDIRNLAINSESKLRYVGNDEINRSILIPAQSGAAQMEDVDEVLNFKIIGGKFSEGLAYIQDNKKKTSTKPLSYASDQINKIYEFANPSLTDSIVSAKVKRLTVYKNGVQETRGYHLIEIIEFVGSLDLFDTE